MAQRAKTNKRPKLSAMQIQEPYTGKLKWQVCSECIVEKYGKATDNQPQLLATPRQVYRMWGIRNDRLVSFNWDSNFVWEPGIVAAKCNKPHEVATKKSCRCGLYGLDSAYEAANYRLTKQRTIVGAVELWGKYIGERGHGWRAQYGKVVALLCGDWASADTVHQIAKTYSVPVAHNIVVLESTIWAEYSEAQDELEAMLNPTEGDDQDGHGQGIGAGRGHATAGEAAGEAANDDTSRAPCREACRRASTVQELKRLLRDGVISISNVSEVLEDI